eukprot:CAMPEP_0170485430 /NCGR_PEP_ID=MMETSP0208-20121228/4707_1 /TAXON_ID=197538 /ORGANISM="Strombidium inclinatum, Strain S3" /LENGTH=153 /DNA_ID=CAMNT_0010759087 /DNA_START=1254 /DNA_END=1715 /DNA_ORIENTATION=+
MTVSLARLLLLDFLLELLLPHPGLAVGPDSRQELVLEGLVPLAANLGDVFKRLMVLVKEVLWKLVHILTVPELCEGDLASFFEGAILIQDFMNLVLDFSLKVQVLQQTRDHFGNVLSLGVLRFQDLVLDHLLDGPEDIRILDVFEDQLTLFVV